jgi:hypothetical protein
MVLWQSVIPDEGSIVQLSPDVSISNVVLIAASIPRVGLIGPIELDGTLLVLVSSSVSSLEHEIYLAIFKIA